MKQDKIVNKINAKSGTSENLGVAKKAKFDEFYTPADDIANELNHWKHKLIGKRIICPCDWDVIKDEDIYSVTIDFAEEALAPAVTYTVNKIKKVTLLKVDISNTNQDKDTYTERVIEGAEAMQLLSERVTCNFVNYLLGIANECKIKSITASGYDGINKRGFRFQDVDYSQFDVCITNPPFSLYKKFMSCMMTEYDSRDRKTNPFDFIILAPLTNRQCPNVAEPLTERKVFLGYHRDTHILFRNPNEKATHDKKKPVDVDWITTWDDAQNEVDKYLIVTGVDYNIYRDSYHEMNRITLKDGSHPIQIKDKRAIPEFNYSGWMFASIGVLNKLSYKYYEWHITSVRKFYHQKHPELNPLQHKMSDAMYEGGFHGVLFRRKPDVPYEPVTEEN